MSERPEADKVEGAKQPGGPGSKVDDKPKTQEKPGTGKPVDTPPPPPPPPGDKGKTWTGSDKYPDGFQMRREDDGTIALIAPDNSVAIWDETVRQWIDPLTKEPMPEDWSKGHEPGTSFDSGQGTPKAHPLPPDQP